MIEGKPVDLALIQNTYAELAGEFEQVLVEGVGGWEVPIRGYDVGDLAKELGLPVLLVVDNRLGALNHTILTARAIASRGLECAGIILNHVGDERDSASVSNRVVLGQTLASRSSPTSCMVRHRSRGRSPSGSLGSAILGGGFAIQFGTVRLSMGTLSPVATPA